MSIDILDIVLINSIEAMVSDLYLLYNSFSNLFNADCFILFKFPCSITKPLYYILYIYYYFFLKIAI